MIIFDWFLSATNRLFNSLSPQLDVYLLLQYVLKYTSIQLMMVEEKKN
ncbi:hypothetical protein [Buchnera aphidicola]|nr:hypothetical protein [Buchnera aphidicola]